uniref:Uncharacterized protein n=1 Tax=Pipistrellus kuhlii TaxID=59472 RepID=A0A7J8A8H0_PIPKU|nr:hypothetical protein mPipKuh1_008990 [Pipistrellus kuhlii]
MFAELVLHWPLELNTFLLLSSVLWHANYFNAIQGEPFEAILPLFKDHLWPLGRLRTPLWLPPGRVYQRGSSAHRGCIHRRPRCPPAFPQIQETKPGPERGAGSPMSRARLLFLWTGACGPRQPSL